MNGATNVENSLSFRKRSSMVSHAFNEKPNSAAREKLRESFRSSSISQTGSQFSESTSERQSTDIRYSLHI
jgi:hypothetical protein